MKGLTFLQVIPFIFTGEFILDELLHLFQGTYLDAVNKSLCVQCSYCGEGEVVLSKCTSGNDTQCGKIPVRPLPSKRPQASTQQPSIPTMSSHSHRTFTSRKGIINVFLMSLS